MTYVLPNDSGDLANRERIESLWRLYEAGDTSLGPELMRLIGKRMPKLRQELTRVTGQPLDVECLSGEADHRPEPVKAFGAMTAFEAIIKCELNPPIDADCISPEAFRKQIESEKRLDE